MKARAKAETRSTTHRKPGVRIGSHDEAKLRLLAAARGEQPLSHDEPRIWFESVDTLLRVFPRVYRGTHVGHPAITVLRAASVELVAERVTGYADGEPVGPLPLTARCVPGALRVVGP